jgi:plasmid stability protein
MGDIRDPIWVMHVNTLTIDKLSPETWRSLEERARAHRKSIEEEVAEIIEKALGVHHGADWRRESAERIAAMTPKGVEQTDSTLLIREDRDR